MSMPTVIVREEVGCGEPAAPGEGSVLVVFVDYHRGQGPQFVASVPTGIGGHYPAARERSRREAEHRVAEIVASYGAVTQ